MTIVTLRNGTEAPEQSVVRLMGELNGLWSRGPMGVYALYALGRIITGNRDQVSLETFEELKDLGFIGKYDSIDVLLRNVVLSLPIETNLSPNLPSPLAQQGAKSDCTLH